MKKTISMNIYLGKTGLNASWQKPFKPTTKCHKCKGKARIMFVGMENERPAEFICDLHNNGGEGNYWLHDACAIASYLCTKCFEVTSILNQA